MSQASEARISALDDALDGAGGGDGTSEELFAVVDALDSTSALRRALSDPGTDPAAREGLAREVFGSRTSAPVVDVVIAACRMRWGSPSNFVAALERQAVRAELRSAEAAGRLTAVEDELFRFARVVEAQRELRNSLADRSVPLVHRQQLVQDLLSDRTGPSTVRLARRAVAARERTFGNTIDSYVDLAAAQRNRSIATVRVAHPISGDQIDRLTAALSRQAGRPIAVQVVVDPSVIGGVRVEQGDQVIEGTVAGRLDDAGRTLGA